MEGLKSFPSLIALAATMLVILSVVSVKAQLSTPCTASMVTSFTPCINFITGSTANGASPNAGCCDSVKSLMNGSMDCACLIVTGNVPISLPINRTLALSLPQACKSSLPLQCKASGVPLPAPGPVLFAPPVVAPAASPLSPVANAPSPFSPLSPVANAPSPFSPLSPVANAPSPFSPTASKSSLAVAKSPAESPAEPPAETQDETPEETPASAPVHSVAPKTTPGIKPIVTSTSASNPSYIPSPFVLVVFMGIITVFKGY